MKIKKNKQKMNVRQVFWIVLLLFFSAPPKTDAQEEVLNLNKTEREQWFTELSFGREYAAAVESKQVKLWFPFVLVII